MVEWKKLVSVADVLYGYPFESSFFSEDSDNIPLIRIRDVKPAIASTYFSGNYSEDYIIRKGDILVGMDGEFNLEKWNDRNGLLNQRVLKLSGREGLSIDGYLYHYMGPVFKNVEKQTPGGSVKHLSAKVINSLIIPIPSLSDQERIAGILDTFTSAIDNLKAQIAQRRKQYEFYRDQLLDLEGKEGVEMKTLGEVCEIRGRIGFRGYTRDDQVEKGEGVISLSPGNIDNGQMVYNGCTYITWEKYEESPEIKTFNGDILFCKTGSTVGKVAMVKELPCEATINPQLVVLKNITIDPQYLNYILGTYKIQTIVKRLAGIGSVPNISQEKLGNITIPVPSLQEQHRIVAILDTFEASISNLEAQLKQRERQYEYYRNKLLTFD